MTQFLPLLQQSALFSGVPETVLRQQILPHCFSQAYTKDQFLITPQQRVDHLGLVLSGKIQVLHLFPDGNCSLIAAVLPGRFLGADLVCTRSRIAPYHAAAVTASQVLYLPVTLLTQPGSLQEDLRLDCLNRLLTLIAQENMKREYRLAILAQKSLRERIVVYLTMQANRRRTRTFEIPFSRDEMAAFLCVNRSALSHELSLMQQEGLIKFRKNRFTILGWELDGAAG